MNIKSIVNLSEPIVKRRRKKPELNQKAQELMESIIKGINKVGITTYTSDSTSDDLSEFFNNSSLNVSVGKKVERTEEIL